MDLLNKKCAACEGGVEPFNREQAEEYLKETPGWRILSGNLKIEREFEFPAGGSSASGRKSPFMEAMSFVKKVADLAESEGHHPDIHILYNHVRLELSTHAIGGLSENDFILAAKINELK